MNIKRNDFVTLNADTKTMFGASFYPAGTKCRVLTAKRDGTLLMSVEGSYGSRSLYVNKNAVTKITPPKANVKVGDIFKRSWGYGQTNVDFYRITAVLPNSVKYVSIGGNATYTGPMCGETVPDLQSVGGNTSMARIRVDGNGTVSFKINSFSTAFPWNGEPCFFSEWN